MENSMLNNLLFDPAYLIIGLAALTLVLMILTLVCFSQYRKLYPVSYTHLIFRKKEKCGTKKYGSWMTSFT